MQSQAGSFPCTCSCVLRANSLCCIHSLSTPPSGLHCSLPPSFLPKSPINRWRCSNRRAAPLTPPPRIWRGVSSPAHSTLLLLLSSPSTPRISASLHTTPGGYLSEVSLPASLPPHGWREWEMVMKERSVDERGGRREDT